MKRTAGSIVGVAALLIAFSVYASAQTTSTEGSAVVAGTVIDSVTHAPLREVGVRARNFSPGRPSPQTASATTDGEGHFTMEGLQPGRYFFSAMRAGYVGQRISGGGSNGRMLVVAPDQRTSDLIIELIPGANLSGRVKNSDGQPLAGVIVECVRQGSGEQQHAASGTSSTNSEGAYTISGLPAGQYYLRAVPPAPAVKNSLPDKSGPSVVQPAARAATAREKQQVFAPTYYPSATTRSGAASLTLRSGDDLSSVEITLSPVQSATVMGKVTIAGTSNVAAGALLTLISDDASTFQRETTADAKGNFELRNVPSGDYALIARTDTPHDDYRTGFWGQQPVRVEETNVRVAVPIGHGVQVSGRVRVEDKSGVDLTGISASLQPEGNASVTALMPDITSVALRADGTFTFADVPENAYTLEFTSIPAGYYLKSSGPIDVLDAGITVAHNQAPPLIDLALSPNSAQITGTVSSDSNPASGAFVVLVPEGSRSHQNRFYKRSVADQSGRFSIRGIVPGDYKAIALLNVERSVLTDPEFLQRFADRGETLHLQEGSTLTVSLDAIAADELTP